jgi:hypothetical protein
VWASSPIPKRIPHTTHHTSQIININLLPPSPYLKLRSSIRNQHPSMNMYLRRRLLLNQPPVIFQKDMAKYNLDLIRSKKPPWASVLSVAKTKVVRARRHKLCDVLLTWLLTHLYEPIPVELLWVAVVRGVPVVGRCHGGDSVAWE